MGHCQFDPRTQLYDVQTDGRHPPKRKSRHPIRNVFEIIKKKKKLLV